MAPNERFGLSALCGWLPTSGLGFPHCADGSRRAVWAFRTVRTAPDERFGLSALCGRLPTSGLGFPHCADGSRRAVWAFRTVRIVSRQNLGPPAPCGSLPDGTGAAIILIDPKGRDLNEKTKPKREKHARKRGRRGGYSLYFPAGGRIFPKKVYICVRNNSHIN